MRTSEDADLSIPGRGILHGWLSFRFLLFTKSVLFFFLTRFEDNSKATMLVNKYIWARTILRHLSTDIMRSFNKSGPLSLHQGQSQLSNHASSCIKNHIRQVQNGVFYEDMNILSAQRFQQKLISQSKEFTGWMRPELLSGSAWSSYSSCSYCYTTSPGVCRGG